LIEFLVIKKAQGSSNLGPDKKLNSWFEAAPVALPHSRILLRTTASSSQNHSNGKAKV